MSDEMVKAADTPRRNVGLAARSFEEAKAQASALAQAEGFVPRSALGKPAAVLAALMTGAELGIGPMEALRSIHVIEGKPTLSAEFMLTRAIQAGVRHQWLETSAKEARIKLSREGWEPMTLSFTMAEAEAAGVCRKDNWRKYPAAMLRARCISAAVRAYCPDVLGAGLYTPEEMGAETDESGVPVLVDHVPDSARNAGPERHESRDVRARIAAACEPVDMLDADAEGYGLGDQRDPEQPAAPAQLRECRTAEELQAWIAAHAPHAAEQHGGDVVGAKALEHAGKIGVDPADVDRWLGAAIQQ